MAGIFYDYICLILFIILIEETITLQSVLEEYETKREPETYLLGLKSTQSTTKKIYMVSSARIFESGDQGFTRQEEDLLLCSTKKVKDGNKVIMEGEASSYVDQLLKLVGVEIAHAEGENVMHGVVFLIIVGRNIKQ